MGTMRAKNHQKSIVCDPLHEAVILGHDLFDPFKDLFSNLRDLIGVELSVRAGNPQRSANSAVTWFRSGSGMM